MPRLIRTIIYTVAVTLLTSSASGALECTPIDEMQINRNTYSREAEIAFQKNWKPEGGLPLCIDFTVPGGRIGVITIYSPKTNIDPWLWGYHYWNSEGTLTSVDYVRQLTNRVNIVSTHVVSPFQNHRFKYILVARDIKGGDYLYYSFHTVSIYEHVINELFRLTMREVAISATVQYFSELGVIPDAEFIERLTDGYLDIDDAVSFAVGSAVSYLLEDNDFNLPSDALIDNAAGIITSQLGLPSTLSTSVRNILRRIDGEIRNLDTQQKWEASLRRIGWPAR